MRDADGSSAAGVAAAAAAGTSSGEGFAGAPPMPRAEAPVELTSPSPPPLVAAVADPHVISSARIAAEAADVAVSTVPATPSAVPSAVAGPAGPVPAAPAPAPIGSAEADRAAAVVAAPADAAPAVAPLPATPSVAAAPVVFNPRRAPPESFKTLVFQAGGIRKTVLSFLFMLLLPFYGSLAPMFLQRLGKVPPLDLAGFVAMATAFTLLMLLILFELMVSIRSRVVLGPKTIKFTLPARGGLIPAFSYVTQEVPYEEIDYVEVRREVYGGRLAPVLLRGARIVTRDGQKIPLGYVSEANEDAVIPFPEIASELCRRVGREAVDRGSVRRTLRKKFMKVAATAEENVPLSDAEIAARNRGHNRLMIGLVSCLLVLLAAGIARDVMTMTADDGERAANVAPKKGGRT